MNNIKAFSLLILLVSLLAACTPQAPAEITPTSPPPTQTLIPATATPSFTPLPTETLPPTQTATAVPPSCAVPLNPTDNATVPASGPFDFRWAPFDGASSYVISIGPAGWYPTNFPATGTTLTRYMETFPSSPSYEWSIAALNASGQQICTTGPYTFATAKDLQATPSSASNNGSVNPTQAIENQGGEPAANSVPDRADDYIVRFDSISVVEEQCSVVITLSVTSKMPIDMNYSVLRYTTDASEASSGDFCNWGHAINLQQNGPGIYQAGFDLLSGSYPFGHLQNGDVVYFMAKFIHEGGGTVVCSPLIQHTITNVCSGE